jgi:DNA-directed RNA polymerase specialized sigma24 family protein
VIAARLIDGLPFEDIGRQMGKSAGAVRVLFFRAVRELRDMLEDKP